MQQISTSSTLKLPAFQLNILAMSEIGKIIKGRVKELGKTQEWLAEQVGVSKAAVSKWVRDGKISRESAIKVSQVLEISADRLLLGQAASDAPAPNETTLERLNSDEKRLLELYRRATSDGQLMIYGAAMVAPKSH
jgi:transcriptional regulator with XRE-family HTH domain